MVSVLLPTYNRASFLVKCIDSVLNQTFQDLELIIVDDGSTDNTQQLVESYEDKRIRYFQYSHSGEISKIRNICLEKTKGEYITFIDSDDLWYSNKLQKQLDALSQNPEAGYVLTNAIEFENNKVLKDGIYTESQLEELSAPTNLLPYILNNQLAIYPSTVMLTRPCISETGKFNQEFKSSETEYLGRAACLYPVFIIPEKLVKIRKHDHNLSFDDRDNVFDQLFGLIDYLLRRKVISKIDHKRLYTEYHYRSAMTKINYSNYKAASAAFYQALKTKPLSAKIWIRYFQSQLNRFSATEQSK